MATEANIVGDEELVQRGRQGDAQAFGLLVERYQDPIYTLVSRTLGDPVRAQDVAQETFIRAWRALPGFHGQSKFSSWLYRIALNCCYSELRRRGVPAETLDPEQWDGLKDAASEGGIERDLERRDLVERLLRRLPPLYRYLVTLFYLEGLDCQEIARITERPVGTVKAYLHRARAELRRGAEHLLKVRNTAS
ncbi:MAG: sigma-70 family RNA polymerase sigma factor [Candidatus Zixiibacteriota bacterium]|nr:MAG: sigma-70 family RNA polymerase sigma factor [candidate division Zixibacteria bacterium]